MDLVTIIIIYILLFLSYYLSKSIIHPATITCAVWSCILTVYSHFDHGFYILSDKFYIAIMLWIFPFVIVSIFMGNMKFKISNYISFKPNVKLYGWLFRVALVCMLIVIYTKYRMGENISSENFIAGLRSVTSEAMENYAYVMPLYLYPVVTISTYSFLLFFMIEIADAKNCYTKKIAFLLILLLFYIVNSEKLGIIQFLIGLFVILYCKNKITILRIICIIVSMLIISFFIQLSRNDMNLDLIYLTEFLTKYFLAPLPAFDQILNSKDNYIVSFNGEYTFYYIVLKLQQIGFLIKGNPDPLNYNNWTYVPDPINVHTVMYSYFVDFGYLGIICFSLIWGVFWGILYSLKETKMEIFILIYSSLFYILIFQFFADFMFVFPSKMFYIISFSLLAFICFKNKSINI